VSTHNQFWPALRPVNAKLPVIIAYITLLVLSLPIPLLHHYQTDKAIETVRPYFKLPDGTYGEMLMPADFLFLRWLGELSWYVTFGFLVAFVFSFWRENLRQCSMLFCFCSFAM